MIADKIVLSWKKVPLLRFIPLLFVYLALFSFIVNFRYGGIDWQRLYEPKYLALFGAMITIAVVWNIFYYRGLQQEDILEFELIMMLSPLVTIILAEVFLPSERNFSTFLAGVIASFALIATRFRRHHIKISKTAWQTMFAMLLLSAESILIKELLHIFSPVSLYLARTTVIALVFLIIYRPKIFAMSRSAYFLTMLSAAFGVVQMVLKFYGFAALGVVETTMILVLGPFLVYFLSPLWFKEKIYKRDILAFAVLVACILYVTIK